MAGPLQESLEMLDHRIECAVGVIWGTAQRQPERALVCHMLGEYTHQTRFANASLTAKQDRLAQSVATLRPALSQQPHLMLPAHQGRHPASHSHVKATLGSAFCHHAVHSHGRLNPLQTGAAEVV